VFDECVFMFLELCTFLKTLEFVKGVMALFTAPRVVVPILFTAPIVVSPMLLTAPIAESKALVTVLSTALFTELSVLFTELSVLFAERVKVFPKKLFIVLSIDVV
jgi:hypothetical protein